MLERGFLIFSIFLLFFFWIFFPGSSMNGIRDKFFFSLFLGLSLLDLTQTVLDRNNTGINFFNLLNFFWNFLARVEHKQNSELKFFSLFLGLSHPVWLKILTERVFSIFWMFYLFFSEFSCLGRVLTEFRTKIFLSLFRHISSRFG